MVIIITLNVTIFTLEIMLLKRQRCEYMSEADSKRSVHSLSKKSAQRHLSLHQISQLHFSVRNQKIKYLTKKCQLPKYIYTCNIWYRTMLGRKKTSSLSMLHIKLHEILLLLIFHHKRHKVNHVVKTVQYKL